MPDTTAAATTTTAVPEVLPAAAAHRRRPSDPLNWFGVLVPQSLRTAQTRFTEGTPTRLLLSWFCDALEPKGGAWD